MVVLFDKPTCLEIRCLFESRLLLHIWCIWCGAYLNIGLITVILPFLC